MNGNLCFRLATIPITLSLISVPMTADEGSLGALRQLRDDKKETRATAQKNLTVCSGQRRRWQMLLIRVDLCSSVARIE
jgi:hypothetical protein